MKNIITALEQGKRDYRAKIIINPVNIILQKRYYAIYLSLNGTRIGTEDPQEYQKDQELVKYMK